MPLLTLRAAFAAEVTPVATPIPNRQAYALYIENDTRKMGGPGSDQAYSNGLKFSYLFAEDKIPSWATRFVNLLPFFNREKRPNVNFGMSVGHQIYTPHDTLSETLIPDDRPYAGWLYLGFAFSYKHGLIGHFLDVDIGIIGPSALGQQVQNNFHHLLREDKVYGWKNGLHDEPTIQISYQERLRSYKSTNLDFFPYIGGSLGNVQIGAHVGGIVRFGTFLPDDFGPSRPSASEGDSFLSINLDTNPEHQSYYVFAGARGNALARNIFLDGNSFRSSHHVTKIPLTFETDFGAGLLVSPFGLVWRFVTRSPEFEERKIFNSFASLNLLYIF